VPATHFAQFADVGLATESDHVPPSQAWQVEGVVAPVEGEYVPATQRVQAEEFEVVV